MPTDVSISEKPTYNISGVEIFSAGKWNDDDYSVEDLHNMVNAYNNLKDGFSPYLKLGHDNNQKLAKSSGLPSVGWINNLYVQGQKLIADFSNIPREVFELIKSKAYRKVSSEIYWNLDVNGTTYPRVLSAVALLGAETPGVMNLQDILGKYGLFENKNTKVYEQIEKNDNFKAYKTDLLTNLQERDMSDDNKEKEIEVKAKALEKEIAEAKKYSASLASEKSELEKQLEAQKKELEVARQAAAQAKAAEQEAKVAKFVKDLESKDLATPAMKDHLTELMSDKKTFSIKEKEATKEDLITEVLELAREAAKVNFTENSKSEKTSKNYAQEELDKQIEEYHKKHSVPYEIAYKKVMKDQEQMKKDKMAEDEKMKKMKEKE